MKINTELVGEKVPEKKSCPPFFLAFCKVYYSPQGQIFRIYIYTLCILYIYGKPNQIRIHDVLLYSSFFYVGLIRLAVLC